MRKLAKVRLSDDHGNAETLWAIRLGNDLYRLANIPIFAYRVSWGDVIEARPREPGGFPELVRVVEKSGYRTLRLSLDQPCNESPASQAILDRLIEMGCGYEGATHSHFAVHVPPSVDLVSVRRFLFSTGQLWEHADPTLEDLYPRCRRR